MIRVYISRYSLLFINKQIIMKIGVAYKRLGIRYYLKTLPK